MAQKINPQNPPNPLSFLYNILPSKPKAPTSTPSITNLFELIEVTRDNLLIKHNATLKIGTNKDDQMALALRRWSDDKSFDKNNKNNKKLYLDAISKIMEKNDDNFIRKCIQVGVNEDRIEKFKKFTETEFERLQSIVEPSQPILPAPLNIKIVNRQPLLTESDIKSIEYQKLAERNRSNLRKPETTLQKGERFFAYLGNSALKVKDGAEDAFGALRKGIKKISDPEAVSPWRFRDEGGDKFSLSPGILDKVEKRASPSIIVRKASIDTKTHPGR